MLSSTRTGTRPKRQRRAGVEIGLCALLIGIGLSAVTVPARAQDRPSFDLRVQRSAAARLPLRLRPPIVRSSVEEAVPGARRIAQRLVDDLVYSGLFGFVAPVPDGIGPPTPAPDDWSRPEGTAAVAEVELTLTGLRPDQMVLMARLLEPEPGGQRLGRRYSLDLARVDRTVHHLADLIVRELTGETGIAQTRILFSRKVGEGRELFLVDYDGRNRRQITRNGSLNLLPRWSPDGHRICYTSYWNGKQRLLVLDGRTGRSRKIAEYSGLNYGADFSPDGRELVVTLSRDGDPEIYRIDLDGAVKARLTFEPSIDCSPVFDPTGNQVAYTSDRTGVPQLYAMSREGARRRRLTYEGSYNDGAAWSPRGDRIAYVSRRSGHFQIFTVEPDGSHLQAVTLPEEGDFEDPAWAPDGRHLVVAGRRQGSPRRLWVIDVDSGWVRPLTTGDVDDSGPHWSRPPESARTTEPPADAGEPGGDRR